MNTPQGFILDSPATRPTSTSAEVLFTPILAPQYLHMIAAAYMVAGYLVASVYAVGWLRGRRDRYHRLGFLVPFTVAAIVTPVQFMIGDSLAAPSTRSSRSSSRPWRSCGRPDRTSRSTSSAGCSRTGRSTAGSGSPVWTRSSPGSAGTPWSRGCRRRRRTDRPTIREANITHFAFDTMVGVGTVLLGLALWYGAAWVRRRDMPRSRWFYRCAALAGVASVVAIEAGWITAEVGRQPWIVYNADAGVRGGDGHQRRPHLDVLRDRRRDLRAWSSGRSSASC